MPFSRSAGVGASRNCRLFCDNTRCPAAGGRPHRSLTDVARTISDQTYVFEANIVGLESAAFGFVDGSAEATGHVKAAGNPPVALSIGLDCVYRFRFDDVGRLVAARGSWADAQTFVIEYISVTANDQSVLQFRFQGDRVEVAVGDAYFGTGPTFEGRLQ